MNLFSPIITIEPDRGRKTRAQHAYADDNWFRRGDRVAARPGIEALYGPLIARSADFYGPDTNNSVIGETVAKNLIRGKAAQVFGDVSRIHTLTYTPDAAKATALLGNTDDAYDQVWHVPTTQERLTMLQWIELFADETHQELRMRRLPRPLFYLLGVFLPLMKEFPEMMYQNEMDYVFDSSKFEKRFGIAATAPAEGVKVTVDYLRRTLRPVQH